MSFREDLYGLGLVVFSGGTSLALAYLSEGWRLSRAIEKARPQFTEDDRKVQHDFLASQARQGTILYALLLFLPVLFVTFYFGG